MACTYKDSRPKTMGLSENRQISLAHQFSDTANGWRLQAVKQEAQRGLLAHMAFLNMVNLRCQHLILSWLILPVLHHFTIDKKLYSAESI